MEGTVKFFNESKNYGFIAGNDGKEYFVHRTGLKQGTTLKEGDSVSFKTAPADKGAGLKAVDVEKGKEPKAAEVKKAKE